jgi:hypothetical protein
VGGYLGRVRLLLLLLLQFLEPCGADRSQFVVRHSFVSAGWLAADFASRGLDVDVIDQAVPGFVRPFLCRSLDYPRLRGHPPPPWPCCAECGSQHCHTRIRLAARQAASEAAAAP